MRRVPDDGVDRDEWIGWYGGQLHDVRRLVVAGVGGEPQLVGARPLRPESCSATRPRPQCRCRPRPPRHRRKPALVRALDDPPEGLRGRALARRRAFVPRRRPWLSDARSVRTPPREGLKSAPTCSPFSRTRGLPGEALERTRIRTWSECTTCPAPGESTTRLPFARPSAGATTAMTSTPSSGKINARGW